MPFLDPPRKVNATPRIQYAPSAAGLIVGIGVTLAGVFIIIASFNVFGGVDNEKSSIMLWMGSLFSGMGLMLLVRMWKHWLWSREAKTRSEKWRRDYDWPMRGTRDDSGRQLIYHAAGLLLMAAFLGLLHYVFLREMTRESGLSGLFLAIPILAFGLFDLVWLISAGYYVYRAMHWFKFGRSEVLYQGAPFRLGDEMRLRFQGNPALAASGVKASAQLRCVEDRVIVHGSGKNQSRNVVSMMLYEDVQPLQADSRGAADIAFALPAEGPETNLGNPEDFTRYWEVVVTAALPGVDYEGVFLVPVYKSE